MRYLFSILFCRCRDKADFISMAKSTEHLDGRGRERRRGRSGSSLPQGGNPNDWISPESDTRIDLIGPVWRAAASALNAVASFAAAHPALATIMAVVVFFAAARISHLRGPHTDIPFRQYLRFQARSPAHKPSREQMRPVSYRCDFGSP